MRCKEPPFGHMMGVHLLFMTAVFELIPSSNGSTKVASSIGTCTAWDVASITFT